MSIGLYMILGIFLFFFGLLDKGDLYDDAIFVSVGKIVLFAIIAFIVGIGVYMEVYWMLILLIPFVLVAFILNLGEEGLGAVRLTWCEFAIGTGIGCTLAFALVILLVVAFLSFCSKQR